MAAKQPLKRYNTTTSAWEGIASGSVSDGITEYSPNQIVNKTSADITYYVRTDGSDSNNGLTNTAVGAFKTITKAIGAIPKVVNHKVIIYISAGTYSESVVVSGLITDNDFSIIGSGVVNIVSLEVINCYGTINITGLTATTTTKDSFKASSSGRVVFTSCIASVTSTFSSFWTGSSNVFIDRCTISNRSVGVSSMAESILYIGGCSGTNNGIACLSGYGSYLGYSGSMHSGNMVAQDGSILIPSSGVLNPWGDNTVNSRSAVSAFQTTGQLQSLSAGVTTKVLFPGLNYDHLGEFSSSRFTAKKLGIYLVTTTIAFPNPATNNPVNVSVYLNGVSAGQLYNGVLLSSATGVVNGATQLKLNAGDYVEIFTISTLAATLIASSLLGITQIA